MAEALTLRVLDHLGEIDEAAWDGLAGDNNPFLEHAFLRGLELSDSVGPRATGWIPRHLAAFVDSRLVGAVPLYEKLDSRGEYIFDWGWAEAAERAGIPYYPKLVAAMPFTPVTGRRLLVAPDLARADRERVEAALVTGVRRVADEIGASSVHLLFLTEAEQRRARANGFLPRSSYQFHWHNAAGWQTFADYLASMRSRTRKQVRHERQEAQSHGLEIAIRRGDELGAGEWLALWELYRINTAHKWAVPYLTREFFAYARERLAHRVVAATASAGDEVVAAALLFHKGDSLYGRYWGARAPLNSMHFELCYYLPIEWCLTHGIARFEAGAQGEHKLKRGLLPSPCHSAHWIRHPGLAAAVAEFLPREARGVAAEMQDLSAHGPFKAPTDSPEG